MTDPSRPPDVWGDEPDPARGGALPPLDPALDPDRFDPSADAATPAAALPPPRLDPARDPDRFGSDRTLTEMLGDGAQEDSRDNYVWLVGLLSMLVFLGLVALVARNLGP